MDRTTTTCRTWAVTRKDGLVLGFTDHDTVLDFEGIRFRPHGGMAAAALVQATGLSVDNSEAIGLLSDDAITEADLRAGRWDGAEMRLWEVDWAQVANRKLLFRGHLGEITASGAGFRAELRGLTEALNQPRGRVYHPRCAAVLGDGACRFNLAKPGFRGEGVVREVVGSGEWIVEGFEAHAEGWFAHGKLEILSGHGEGLTGVIRADEPLGGGARRLGLWQPPSVLPVAGDALRLTAGCDKAAATCRLKFDNYRNFRGFPHLPPEDWLLAPGTVRATEPRAGARPAWAPTGGGGEG